MTPIASTIVLQERVRFNFAKLQFHDLQRGLLYRPSRVLDTPQFLAWFRQKLNDLTALPQLLLVAFTEELMAAWGLPGQPGDALNIQSAVDKMILGYGGLLEWEIDVYFTHFPQECEPIRQKMQGWTEHFLNEIERMPGEIAKEFTEPRPNEPRQITFVFRTPENLQEVIADIGELITSGRRSL